MAERSLNSIWDRIEDYLALGVPVCWIVDPVSGRDWTTTPAGLTNVTGRILRAGEIDMALAEVLE